MTTQIQLLPPICEPHLAAAVAVGWGEGGFTIDLDGYPFESWQDDNYAVSMMGTQRRFRTCPTTNVIWRYVDHFRARLCLPGHYLGGWIHCGIYYLDVSRVVRGRSVAETLARHNEQKSFYCYTTRKAIFTPQD